MALINTKEILKVVPELKDYDLTILSPKVLKGVDGKKYLAYRASCIGSGHSHLRFYPENNPKIHISITGIVLSEIEEEYDISYTQKSSFVCNPDTGSCSSVEEETVLGKLFKTSWEHDNNDPDKKIYYTELNKSLVYGPDKLSDSIPLRIEIL